MSAAKYTKEQIAAAGEDYKKNGQAGMSPENKVVIRWLTEKANRIKAAATATPPPIPSQDEHQPDQEPPKTPKPGIETGVNENAAKSQPEALETVQTTADTSREEHVNSLGILIPGKAPTKESRKEEVEKLKDKINNKKLLLRSLKKGLHRLSGEKKANVEKQISDLEFEIEESEKERKTAEQVWKATPPEPIADEDAPWFGRVYANCRNFYVKMDDGTYKELSVEAAGGFLREWGISNRPDSPTTSPLDRAKNTIHNRHSVDWAGALAGYRPGIIDEGSNKFLITKGPKLITPVKGEFPTIQKFMDGMFGDQVKYAHSWNHLAVVPLYNEKINQSQVLVLAGPIDSGKSAYQNLIVTPMLGGRVARPYSHMVGRTDFNEDWFECEHLMCEDETPPRDYEAQQRFSNELKGLSANARKRNHGKGKKAVTLAPFWRVTVSVNDNPENLRAIATNDETMADKMVVLKVYPQATVELVESLGGKEPFAAKLMEELPAYLYHLLYEYQLPDELRVTRFDMKGYQNPEIVEAVKETTPYMDLFEVLGKVYSGVDKLNKSVLEILADIQIDPNVPKGVVPQKPSTLSRYLTELSKITNGAIERKHTNQGNRYLLTFPVAEFRYVWDKKK